jgi:hypothetical protein
MIITCQYGTTCSPSKPTGAMFSELLMYAAFVSGQQNNASYDLAQQSECAHPP